MLVWGSVAGRFRIYIYIIHMLSSQGFFRVYAGENVESNALADGKSNATWRLQEFQRLRVIILVFSRVGRNGNEHGNQSVVGGNIGATTGIPCII